MKFNSFKFINSALTADEYQIGMQDAYFHKETASIISTDGFRMHIWYLNEDQVKQYKLPQQSCYVYLDEKKERIIPIPEDGRAFPNWQRIVDLDAERYSSGEPWNFFAESAGIPIAKWLVKNSITINIDYLKPLVSDLIWKYRYHKENPKAHAVEFTVEGKYKVLIMPINWE